MNKYNNEEYCSEVRNGFSIPSYDEIKHFMENTHNDDGECYKEHAMVVLSNEICESEKLYNRCSFASHNKDLMELLYQ